MSGYINSSIVSKVNDNINVKVDEHFEKVYSGARQVYELTNGAFDITVAPLVRYWGFGPTPRDTLDTTSIEQLSKYVGMDEIGLQDGVVKKTNSKTKLDFNGIAQGYSVDVIADYFDRQQIDHYLINVGGEIKAKGISNRGAVWVVGVESPLEEIQIGEYDIAVDLNNKALATSGSYRKFKVIDGVKYSHTIDPRSAKPVQHSLLSVSVVMEDCMMADAYATAFMVLGVDSSRILLDSLQGIEAYFIYTDSLGNWERYETYGFRK
ncbi:MAG: FAD:protein FMN transferase [Bacteroidetes bacterium]|nr:FAD:protein FMN transferase [Bacteroidota bacterium]